MLIFLVKRFLTTEIGLILCAAGDNPQLLKHCAKSLSLLSSLNLEAHNGDITVIEGKNGAGKSTLFNILAGKLPKDKGEIFINNQAFNPEKNA